jgi:hypothetical protein
MQDWLLHIMQLIQYPHVSSFSTVITNEFIGEGFYLSQHSMDEYEAMGCDVTQLTQDMEQSLFTIKTNMPIPVLVYWDAYQWAKYGHHILPSKLDLKSHHKTGIHQIFWIYLIEFLPTDLDRNLVPSSLDLTSYNKAGLHQTFQKSLVEFLCTDFLIEFLCTNLDGNLSFTLNPLTASKLDHFLLTLPEGLPETANEDDKECHQHVWHKKESMALSIR